MSRLHQPPPPPENSGTRAKDLKNQVCLVLPGQLKTEKSNRDDNDWVYVECRVAVCDRSGLVSLSDNVRISWARAVPQLTAFAAEFPDEWMPCKPIEDGNAVILAELEGADLAVAERVVDELTDD
jgi:hypothetical protein